MQHSLTSATSLSPSRSFKIKMDTLSNFPIVMRIKTEHDLKNDLPTCECFALFVIAVLLRTLMLGVYMMSSCFAATSKHSHTLSLGQDKEV